MDNALDSHEQSHSTKLCASAEHGVHGVSRQRQVGFISTNPGIDCVTTEPWVKTALNDMLVTAEGRSVIKELPSSFALASQPKH